MPFSKSAPLSRLIGLITYNGAAKWIRFVILTLFFAVVLSSLPVHLKHDGASAQSSHSQRTQVGASYNPPKLGEIYGNAALGSSRVAGYRSGLSPLAAQSGGVVTVYPGAYQTPAGDGAVNFPDNRGHASTTSLKTIFNINGSDSQVKTCLWGAFQNVIGAKARVTLKFDWSFDGYVEAAIQDSTGNGWALAQIAINYSTDNGANWSSAFQPQAVVVTAYGEESISDGINLGGSKSINLPNPGSIDITQIRVDDSIIAQVETYATYPTGNMASASATVIISNIRLEVEIADTTAPTVTSFSPAAGMTNVNTNANVTVTFSEAMDASTINTETIELRNPSNALVPAAVNYNASTFTATLDPVSLAGGTTYTARVRGGSTDPRVKDAAGNVLAVDKTWTFTTQSINAAAFVSQSVPATMTAGESYPVTVSMLNQGSTTWTPGQAYRLGSQNPQDNTIWMTTTNRVGLLPGESVSPGATTTFSFVVTAPISPGSYNFQWRMVQDGVEWFGAMTPNIAIQVVPRNDSAEFVSQTAPSVMVAGAAYPVSITFRNTGNTTWTAANQYRLGSQNPENNGTWGLGQVYLGAGELVQPGALKTFSFQVVAPSTPGSYNFQWRMLRELVNWFGAASTNLLIAVNVTVDQAQFVSQSVPSVMIPQNAYSVSVTMKNTGNTTWDSNYRLGSDNPVNNLNWGLNRVYLASGETIPPGGSKTFTFTVTAPAGPGSYALFQWRMLREGVQRFGDYSPVAVVALTQGNLNMALIDPINRIGSPGEDLLSRNYNWSLPLLSLPGRAGLDIGLVLSLNSLIYTRAGSVINFDPDQGYPAPGFSLGFPEIRNAFINTDANTPSYLLTMPSGRRVEFRQTNTNVYEAVDSSYMRLTYDPINSVFILYMTDGTQCRFEDVTGLGDYKCVQIKDRNGNFITIGYGSLAEISTVIDTLGREINFNYDSFNHLLSITQNWGGQTHTWATFAYGTQTIQTNFPGLTLNGTANGAPESVLLRVGLADGSVYSFEYNTYAQVKTIRRYAPNNSNPVNFPGDYFQRAYTTYGLPDNASSPQSDCPRITSRADWAYDWNPGPPATYTPGPGYAWGEVTFPDGTIYKEFFATTGWQRGLTTQTENWAGGVRKKWTTLEWTQDNTGVSYRLNPRVTETNVYDEAGNRRRAKTSYTSFGLPSDVYEYDADATTVLRRAHIDYNLSAVYTGRRIIGLPSAQYLYDGADTLFSKVTFEYDQNPNPYLQHQGPPVWHDTANYGPDFVQGRGNLNVTRRWDVDHPDDDSLASESETGYNTSGSVIFTRDPLDHQASFSYADSFSDEQNDRNTYAYPTTTTDPGGISSTAQYNYYFGAVTRTQDPKGAAVTRTYDMAGRIERKTNVVNGAYTRYVYSADQRQVESFTTINDLNPANEFRSVTIFDGLDRVKATTADHPGSVGQYKAQVNFYDVMGRLVEQTNPTEINGSWQPAGDDEEGGWVSSYLSYDWQGKLKLSTDQQGNTKEFLYGGCGCAGGQVVVTRDEMGRRQKMTYDILGRLKTTQALFIQPKNEPLNGDGDVYSTTINTYNVRDQITNISQRAGTSGPEQNTVMSYDGNGRLLTRQNPIESAPTSFAYNADDTLQMMTDARGVTTTYAYNNRHLVTSVTYGAAPGVTHLDPVTFGYDEAGNRLWMDDGPGRVDYNFDIQSRLQSETREITGVGSYTLTYEYNLAGQLKRVTDPAGSSFSYVFNKAGQATGVDGSGPASVPQYATNIQYRAWGSIKHMDFYHGVSMNRTFTARMQAARYELDNVWDNLTFPVPPAGARKMGYNFDYHPDGNLRFAGDLLNNKFDRSYGFDHVGRLNTAFTGKEARGETVPQYERYIYPYSETFNYDVFSNVTSRDGYFWQMPQSDSATYPNNDNRRQGWSYDNSGNVVDDVTTGTHTYDCANRQVKFVSKATVGGFATGFPEEPVTEIDIGYDGDGSSIKRIETRREEVFGQPQPPPTDIQTVVTTTYYLRSSVLGMTAISEIGDDGTKKVGYVYDPAGERLAKQNVWSGGSTLAWHHFPGGTGSWIESDLETGPFWSLGSTRFGRRQEMDPLGADVGWMNPFPVPEPYRERERPLYIDGGDPFDYSGGCALDGLPISCGRAMRMLGGFGGGGPGFGTPPTFGKPPSISWKSVGDFLFSKLPSSGIVNVDPITPPFGGGFGSGFLAAPQATPCYPSWNQIKGPNGNDGIYANALSPVGITVKWDPEKINKEGKPGDWVFGAAKGRSFADIEKALLADGWVVPLIPDPHPDHWGMVDYRKEYIGNFGAGPESVWVHFNMGPASKIVGYREVTSRGERWTVPVVTDDKSRPPVGYSIHREEAMPGGGEHFYYTVLHYLTLGLVPTGEMNRPNLRDCGPKPAPPSIPNINDKFPSTHPVWKR
jgi:YD repeat-containing protein